jgi:hypothetical protein
LVFLERSQAKRVPFINRGRIVDSAGVFRPFTHRTPEETNMLFKRTLALLALAVGFLGIIASMAGGYSVSMVGSRLDQANERLFMALDNGFSSAQVRVRGVQTRLRESKISAGEIAQNIRDWGAGKAKERLVPAVEIENRADKLAGRLQTVNQWLEIAMESIRGMQQMLDLGALFGAPVDRVSLENVLEELMSIQGKLQETEQSINGVHEFMLNRMDESEENRFSRVVKLLSRTELAVGAIDTRLEASLSRLSQIQTDAQQLKARIGNYILLATIGGYLILAWIAVGQVALCKCGWKNCFPFRVIRLRGSAHPPEDGCRR